MNIHEKIALLRRKNGWSQEQLAEWTDVSRQTLSRWESGRTAPNADQIVRLSRLFGVTTDQLLLDEFSFQAPTAPESPIVPDSVRCITEGDTFAFAANCHSEARQFALACASLPMSPAVLFFCFGLSELPVGEDSSFSFMLIGLCASFALLALGGCSLLCSWLGNSERKLNNGQPYVLEPNALAWVSDALKHIESKTSGPKLAAWLLLLLVIPIFFVCLIYSENSDFWIGMAMSLPLVPVSVASYIGARTSRIERCYRRLIERAQQDATDDSTSG